MAAAKAEAHIAAAEAAAAEAAETAREAMAVAEAAATVALLPEDKMRNTPVCHGAHTGTATSPITHRCHGHRGRRRAP